MIAFVIGFGIIIVIAFAIQTLEQINFKIKNESDEGCGTYLKSDGRGKRGVIKFREIWLADAHMVLTFQL